MNLKCLIMCGHAGQFTCVLTDSLFGLQVASDSHRDSSRAKVRMQSYIEMQVFERRWKDAAKKDQCWVDPYEQQQANQTSHQSIL